MTVKELKQELNKYPDSMEVFVGERQTDYAYGLVNSIRSEQVKFAENQDFKDGEELAVDTVLVIYEN